MDAQGLENYAGTSQRYSQRILASEIVYHGWDLCTTDITKAFLQGVTYKEFAEATGEPLRGVNFVCAGLLRSCSQEDSGPRGLQPID